MHAQTRIRSTPLILLLALAVAAPLLGQERRGAPAVRLSSGLYSLLPRESAVVRIVETNRRGPSVDATVVFLDEQDRELSRGAGSVGPGQSLSVAVPYSEPDAGLVAQVRAVVTLENGHRRRNAIVVNMEVLNELDLVAPGRGPSCAPYQFPTNAIPDCPEWAVTVFTAGP